MSKVTYEGSDQFKPLSAWGYVGYTILFAIPFVGIILLIVFSLSSSNINRRNYARSFFCIFLLVVLLTVAFGVLSYFRVGNVGSTIKQVFPQLTDTINRLEQISPKTSQSTNNNTTERSVSTTTRQTKSTSPNEEKTSTTTTTRSSVSSSTNTRKSYNLPEGKYIIGEDILPGKYTITCTGTSGEEIGSAYSSLGSIYDNLGGEDASNYSNLMGSLGGMMGDLINAEVKILGDYGTILKSFELKKDQSVQISLKEKTAIQIENGSCVLTPAN